MSDNISRAIMRAYQSLDVLDGVIGSFDEDAPRVDTDGQGAESRPRLFVGSVPVEIERAAHDAIVAIKGVLTAAQPSIESGLLQRPPEWWRNAVKALRLKVDESASARRLLDALSAFKTSLNPDAPPDLIKFILISDENGLKTEGVSIPSVGFRATNQPYSEKVAVVFKSDVDKDVRSALEEAGCEVIGEFEPCYSLLRTALDNVRIIVEDV